MADVPTVPTIFYHAADIQPILVRQNPSASAAVKEAIAKNPDAFASSTSTSATAQKQKENAMKNPWVWVAIVLMVFVGGNIALGYAHHYGIVNQSPPNLFGRDGGDTVGGTGASNAVLTADVPATTQSSGQWETADNTALPPLPTGWGVKDQGPSCPNGKHRVATGKIMKLPNGNSRAEEVCK